MSNEAVTYNLYLYKKLPFDLERGIAPLTNLFFITQALAVNADLNVTHARRSRRGCQGAAQDAELLRAGRAADPVHGEPQPQHGIDLVKVPFKGGGDAINGVLTGVTPITFLGVGNMLAHLRAGRMNVLLFDGDKRADATSRTSRR